MSDEYRNGLRLAVKTVLIFWVVLGSPAAFAQNIPPGQEPAAQVERFRSDAEKQRKELEKKEIKKPEVQIKEEEKKPEIAGPSFTLKEVIVVGTTVFKPEDFQASYRDYLGKTVSFKDLEAITENIKAVYKKKGYLTTTVYIPDQEIKDGKVKVKVIEGKMGKLKIEGNRWFSSSLLERYYHTKKNEVLNINKLYRDILRLNQGSDLEVKTLISAGQEPETSDVTLKVSERMPYHIGAVVDNHGTRLSGKYREMVLFYSNNLTGNMDSLFVNNLFSTWTFGESVNYSLPIDTYGTKIGVDATYFKLKLGKEYKAYEIRGITQIYTPYISKELYLSENFQASVKAGMDIKSIKKKTLGDLTTDDQLRLPFIDFSFTKTDSFRGQTNFSPRFVFGTSHFLGASSRNHPSASRTGTGGSFFKYEQVLGRTQAMPWESYVTVNTVFQAASHTLPSSEQLQLGGANSVRGYPEGDYLADMGGSLSCNWIFPMYLFPKDWKLPYSKQTLRRTIEPVAFVDVGGGKLKKVNPGEGHRKFLAGFGGGFRIHLYNKASLKLEWAKFIGDKPGAGGGPSTFNLLFQAEM